MADRNRVSSTPSATVGPDPVRVLDQRLGPRRRPRPSPCATPPPARRRPTPPDARDGPPARPPTSRPGGSCAVRAGAMSGRSSVHDPAAQSASAQTQRRLDHTRVTARPKAGQVGQLDPVTVLRPAPGRRTPDSPRAGRSSPPATRSRPSPPGDVEDRHPLEAHQQLAPARRVRRHRGSPRSIRSSTLRTLVEAPDPNADPSLSRSTPLIREAAPLSCVRTSGPGRFALHALAPALERAERDAQLGGRLGVGILLHTGSPHDGGAGALSRPAVPQRLRVARGLDAGSDRRRPGPPPQPSGVAGHWSASMCSTRSRSGSRTVRT